MLVLIKSLLFSSIVLPSFVKNSVFRTHSPAYMLSVFFFSLFFFRYVSAAKSTRYQRAGTTFFVLAPPWFHWSPVGSMWWHLAHWEMPLHHKCQSTTVSRPLNAVLNMLSGENIVVKIPRPAGQQRKRLLSGHSCWNSQQTATFKLSRSTFLYFIPPHRKRWGQTLGCALVPHCESGSVRQMSSIDPTPAFLSSRWLCLPQTRH